jgi:hypothetical protein
MNELVRVLEREIRQLPCSVLGRPESTTLDRSAETDVRVSLRGHERMFAPRRTGLPVAGAFRGGLTHKHRLDEVLGVLPRMNVSMASKKRIVGARALVEMAAD